jgi:hypothetical protein
MHRRLGDSYLQGFGDIIEGKFSKPSGEGHSMSKATAAQEFTGLQKGGIAVFVLLCGIPALEMNGFGIGIPFTPLLAFACATVGGALGGLMICSRPWPAGLIGGLLAGTIGFAAVYYYTQEREKVSTVELVFVQGIGSLPGVGIGLLLKRVLSPPSSVGQRGERPGT